MVQFRSHIPWISFSDKPRIVITTAIQVNLQGSCCPVARTTTCATARLTLSPTSYTVVWCGESSSHSRCCSPWSCGRPYGLRLGKTADRSSPRFTPRSRSLRTAWPNSECTQHMVSAFRVVIPTRRTTVRSMLCVCIYKGNNTTKDSFLKVCFEVQKLWVTE